MGAKQLSLAGFDAPNTERLFLAIFPDAAAAKRIAGVAVDLRRANRLRGEPLAADRFHITLNHLEDFPELPESVVADMKAAAAIVRMHPFEVTFDRAVSFFDKSGNNPLVLRASEAEALKAFRENLVFAMRKAGLGRFVKVGFTPHVTLLYDKRRVDEQPIDRISWTVKEFVLIRSKLGQTRNIRLGVWPLHS